MIENESHYKPSNGRRILLGGLCGVVSLGIGDRVYSDTSNTIPAPIVSPVPVSSEKNLNPLLPLAPEATTSEKVTTSKKAITTKNITDKKYNPPVKGPLMPIFNQTVIVSQKEILNPYIDNSNKVSIPEYKTLIENPPYSLEAFAVTLLEELALKQNVPITDTLTQEHLSAIIAWCWAEGGNINNHDIYNPLNSGIDIPTLIQGEPNYKGIQSFKSFKDGVDATLMTWELPQYSRIVTNLVNPNTTAAEFFNALTYYQNYPNNIYWAKGDTNNPQYGYTQSEYLNNLQIIYSQVISDYYKYAGVKIGNPGYQEVSGSYVPQNRIHGAEYYINKFLF